MDPNSTYVQSPVMSSTMLGGGGNSGAADNANSSANNGQNNSNGPGGGSRPANRLTTDVMNMRARVPPALGGIIEPGKLTTPD
jgi:hypothetical protein